MINLNVLRKAGYFLSAVTVFSALSLFPARINGDVKDKKNPDIAKQAITNLSFKLDELKRPNKQLEDIVVAGIKLALNADSELPVTLNSYVDVNRNNKIDDGDKSFRYKERNDFYNDEMIFLHGEKEKFSRRIVNISLVDQQAKVGREVKPNIIMNSRQIFLGNIPTVYESSNYINLSFVNLPNYHRLLEGAGIISNDKTNRLYTIIIQTFKPDGGLEASYTKSFSVDLGNSSPNK
jgi:hypothetical protein